ncbi:MAG: YqgE/AlgH family protein [Gammaproteobacteria bacterium]|nr:YqgE/AlgH family protein [Gammaproteobacteria bacterium]
MTKQTSCLNNHFLIAMPNLKDGNFSRSVTYICEHDENGAMGITINRPSDIILDEVFQQLGIKTLNPEIGQETVYLGGPVHPDRGFLLHTPNGSWQSSLRVTDTISVTTSRDILEAIANDESPDQLLITVGYAGWAPGQLEYELAENVWLNCPATEEIIFNTPAEKRWDAAARLLGIDLQLLSVDTGHA